MSKKTIARNKKALHEYHIIDTYEAGVMLLGPEVKSIRNGKVSLAESFARVEGNEVFLYAMHVTPYDPASRWNTDPVRPRKLLLNRREIRRLIGETQQEGFTLVPLELYLKDGYIKVALALAKGKQSHDKREDIKRREAVREIQRAVRRR
ncbi:MAG TPA: SsrA-binding protein SmpB [Longimicrobiales bacterium]|nr:SsrA-binding protein SmpB [Longimicrobiales bacterium]